MATPKVPPGAEISVTKKDRPEGEISIEQKNIEQKNKEKEKADQEAAAAAAAEGRTVPKTLGEENQSLLKETIKNLEFFAESPLELAKLITRSPMAIFKYLQGADLGDEPNAGEIRKNRAKGVALMTYVVAMSIVTGNPVMAASVIIGLGTLLLLKLRMGFKEHKARGSSVKEKAAEDFTETLKNLNDLTLRTIPYAAGKFRRFGKWMNGLFSKKHPKTTVKDGDRISSANSRTATGTSGMGPDTLDDHLNKTQKEFEKGKSDKQNQQAGLKLEKTTRTAMTELGLQGEFEEYAQNPEAAVDAAAGARVLARAQEAALAEQAATEAVARREDREANQNRTQTAAGTAPPDAESAPTDTATATESPSPVETLRPNPTPLAEVAPGGPSVGEMADNINSASPQPVYPPGYARPEMHSPVPPGAAKALGATSEILRSPKVAPTTPSPMDDVDDADASVSKGPA